ncbi:hypothetical protein CHCC20441_2023 [Bacillus licheniformis]|uniref:Uncharacterized protein n=1 Tax=Bacillus licheniformis TaxID=1402 RepID=A0A6C1WG34_BACLI|nr:hypothetical protein B4092_3944 [Bacillus licheniformis]TWN10832.1 hypothetical protein CHCC14564_3384 [Bacillus licheniformis LMG 17339]KYC80270.1 hypothetical protein B4090_3607 [Bacillus licheniformis]KYC84657.1 hypothetical protein B4091_3987 [Bacillus licheniformis]KYD00211.1 hypothetical protein B4164_3731 [Bacillus licheniformis]
MFSDNMAISMPKAIIKEIVSYAVIFITPFQKGMSKTSLE